VADEPDNPPPPLPPTLPQLPKLSFSKTFHPASAVTSCNNNSMFWDFRFRHAENSRPVSSTDKKFQNFQNFQNSKITSEVEGKHNLKGKSVRDPAKP
jgi:hypothetical protein